MMIKRLTAVFALLACTVQAGPFEDGVIQQLLCRQVPQPGPVLHALAQADLIDLEKNVGADSSSCFEFASPLTIVGMDFSSICGFDENEDVQAKFPGIFYRGPGTSPGTHLALRSMASTDELTSWYREIGGTKDLVAEPFYSNRDEPSEVTCSIWKAG